MANRKLRFFLDIPAHEYQVYYMGGARDVVAVCHDGRTIRFPANRLRSVVSHDGVYGEFEIEFDQQNRFVALRRIGD